MKTILVVDDEADVRASLERILEAEGHAVLQAKDGVEGLQRVREAPPDLIILDIAMPRMDGYTMLLELRKQDAWKNVPVLILSVKSAEHMDYLFFGRVAGYLEKPCEAATVVKQVQAALA